LEFKKNIYEVKFFGYFFSEKNLVLKMATFCLGKVVHRRFLETIGLFFSNASGHPVQDLLNLGPDKVEIAIPNIERKIDGKTRGIIHSKIIVADKYVRSRGQVQRAILNFTPGPQG
jgi:hypothetical protein